MSATLWYNSGFSDLYHSVRLLREASNGQIRVLASHIDPAAPILQVADVALLEPPRATAADAYVRWALRVCARRRVALFVPSRHALAIAAARDVFARQGVRVHVPTPEVLRLVEHKDALYRDLERTGVALPTYRVVRSLAEFDAGYAQLREHFKRLCIKPTVGIFGSGFRILDEEIDEYDALTRIDSAVASLRGYREMLVRAKRPFELMLMQYLDGKERSVDCLAVAGRLIVAVARRKEGRYQELETAGAAIDAAAVLAHRYGLEGIFNVQFRDAERVACLLEINPRPAGGLLFSCASGCNLPYWSAALALGLNQKEAMPRPRHGIRVIPVQDALVMARGVETFVQEPDAEDDGCPLPSD